MLRRLALPGRGGAVQRGRARPGAPPAAPGASLRRYLCFTVAGIPMAMDLATVQEVVEVPPIFRIPRPAGPAEHLAVVRGRMVLVVDLRRRLGLVNPVTDARTRLIVTAGQARPWAILVDSATEVLTLEATAPEAGAAPGAGLRADFFAGSLEVGGGRIFVPDFAKVLAGG
ncbi:MAG TPA: chemotaxis protein CheW [Candidatus Methylomirabilis sp.]